MTKLSNLEEMIKYSQVFYHKDLKNYSYTKTGGKADILVLLENIFDLEQIILYAHHSNTNLTILGNGSNVLISDKGIRGISVVSSNLNRIELLPDNVVSVESGATLKALTEFLVDKELSGMEFACGIPGSIGGAIFMNAGAYGGEMKDVVLKVETIDLQGNKHILHHSDMAFSYRHSIIQENKHIVTKVYLQLTKGNKADMISKINELNTLRAEKQPLDYPSCGSVFKRPQGYFAGKLIQDAGCQGLTIGGAQVSKKHAGFIVNINNATCEDYKNLIKAVQNRVFEHSGIKLEPEVKIIGE